MISSSFLLDGFNFFAYLTTFLSKKYSPVIAKSDKNFFGFFFNKIYFSIIISFATPNNSGLTTLCKITFAPFFNLVDFKSIEVKF